jgi:acetyltransferase EpsM
VQDRTMSRNSRQIVILGGVGLGVILANTIRTLAHKGMGAVGGFLNDTLPAGSQLAEAPVLGPFESWSMCSQDTTFISAIPKAKDSLARYSRISSLHIPLERWATVVHSDARIANGVRLGAGSYVGPYAVVEHGTKIGPHACLRSGCYVGHDVTAQEHIFIGTNASVLGRSRLGQGAYVAANAACREGTSLGRYSVVGLAAAVVSDIPDFSVVAGSPARIIGHVDSTRG